MKLLTLKSSSNSETAWYFTEFYSWFFVNTLAYCSSLSSTFELELCAGQKTSAAANVLFVFRQRQRKSAQTDSGGGVNRREKKLFSAVAANFFRTLPAGGGVIYNNF